MEAKDTVMSKELQEVYGCVQPQHIAGLEWQAKISFEAGVEEGWARAEAHYYIDKG